MVDLKRKLVAVAMAAVMSGLLCGSAFGQKQGDRPPKQDNTKIVVKEKDPPRPPQNNNTQQPKNDPKKGKPLN
jgi:hypothetical protein